MNKQLSVEKGQGLLSPTSWASRKGGGFKPVSRVEINLNVILHGKRGCDMGVTYLYRGLLTSGYAQPVSHHHLLHYNWLIQFCDTTIH